MGSTSQQLNFRGGGPIGYSRITGLGEVRTTFCVSLGRVISYHLLRTTYYNYNNYNNQTTIINYYLNKNVLIVSIGKKKNLGLIVHIGYRFNWALSTHIGSTRLPSVALSVWDSFNWALSTHIGCTHLPLNSSHRLFFSRVSLSTHIGSTHLPFSSSRGMEFAQLGLST